MTPSFAGKSMVATLGMLVVSFGFMGYNLYLQIKQAKVNKNTARLVEIAEQSYSRLEEIRNLLKK